MPARAIWKGVLKLGDTLSVPVKVYSAVQDRTIHFHILDDRKLTRVKQRMVNPKTGKEVPTDQIRKGYEVEPGVFVMLDEAELRRLEPKASRDIDVAHFIEPELISNQWYERPYYLGPDGDESHYFALSEALSRQNREGLARWVMRKKEYIGVLRSDNEYLMLITLRYAEEVLPAAELPSPAGRPIDPKELQMAEQLVTVLEGDFQPKDFHDEYRERVMQFIESKAKGKRPRLEIVAKKPAPKSLTDTLLASLKAAKSGKGKAVA